MKPSVVVGKSGIILNLVANYANLKVSEWPAGHNAFLGINTVDWPRRNPKGSIERSRWSESAETTGKVVRHDRTPKGCTEQVNVKLQRRIWHPSGVRFVLIIRSGGLRGLRPPATLLAPLRGATQLISRFRWSPRTPTTGYFLCNPAGWSDSNLKAPA